MSDEHEYLTKEKFEEFKNELEYLKSTRRKEVAENLEYAKSLGDLSENAEYHEARDVQAALEDRIARLERMLKNSTIISSHNTNTVSLGSIITVNKEGEKDKKVFTIVGSEEADTKEGKISLRSPFGAAVLGKKKGDAFSFSTPSGTMTYKITDIK